MIIIKSFPISNNKQRIPIFIDKILISRTIILIIKKAYFYLVSNYKYE